MIELGLWLLTGAAMLVGAYLARVANEQAAKVRRIADWIAAIASVVLAVWMATR